MSTPELLSLMRLLSAMESAMLTAKTPMPDHLCEQVEDHIRILVREVLSRSTP
jgi:hypothetical protein